MVRNIVFALACVSIVAIAQPEERPLPLGKVVKVGDMYVMLASPLGAYVTGQAISVDGGWNVA